MTQDEAKAFLEGIFEDMLPNGRVEKVPEFYTKDVVGHYNGEDFYFDDIIRRCQLLKKYIKYYHFKVENFLLVDNLLICLTRQNWISKCNNTLHEIRNTCVYRLRDNKACEIWALHDSLSQTEAAYRTINEDFLLGMEPVSAENQAKKQFFDRLAVSCFLKSAKTGHLTVMEKECLYYYLNGYSSKETANELNLSARTIETHINNLKEKLYIHTKSELRDRLLLLRPRAL